MNNILIILIMAVALSSCNEKTVHPEKWTVNEINQWYEKQDWLGGWQIRPDESINRKNLAIYYHKNQERWDQAFAFLKGADLTQMPLGKQNLEDENLFVIVSEYIPKERSLVRYESHQKYIDIQYVISGEELMGLTTPDKVDGVVDQAYNEEKDIAFYNYDGGDYIRATPENFLVFFPEDVHRPSISAGDSVHVRKIVVKIRID